MPPQPVGAMQAHVSMQQHSVVCTWEAVARERAEVGWDLAAAAMVRAAAGLAYTGQVSNFVKHAITLISSQ